MLPSEARSSYSEPQLLVGVGFAWFLCTKSSYYCSMFFSTTRTWYFSHYNKSLSAALGLALLSAYYFFL
uniref:Uncharacterized protein n=1 Tax=Gossypium raimondii TaxID=29730 RepID=A0A0D2VAK7_GOSRA|nr:hypothetical protein B456_010G145900 [Gossypium raimondii]